MNKINKNTELRILFLEDNLRDVDLMKHELSMSGFKIESKQVSLRKDFLDALLVFKPDIILSDYSLPSFNGMHAFQLFKELKISIPFILVTGSLTEELALECLSEGVDDVILKSSFKRLPSLIIRNIEIKEAAKAKERTAEELETKTEALRALKEEGEKARALELLSSREHEILCLIAAGNSIKEIAGRLFLSPATVATYRARILEKLELKSNVDLTRYALHNNLIN